MGSVEGCIQSLGEGSLPSSAPHHDPTQAKLACHGPKPRIETALKATLTRRSWSVTGNAQGRWSTGRKLCCKLCCNLFNILDH